MRKYLKKPKFQLNKSWDNPNHHDTKWTISGVDPRKNNVIYEVTRESKDIIIFRKFRITEDMLIKQLHLTMVIWQVRP